MYGLTITSRLIATLFAIADDNSSSAVQSQFCAVYDSDHITLTSNGTHSELSCDDVPTTSSAVHPAFYIFVISQMLVGFGGCAILILTAPYIDENASHTKSALYLGISIFIVTVPRLRFHNNDFEHFATGSCFLLDFFTSESNISYP